jgi:hypothetical protein
MQQKVYRCLDTKTNSCGGVPSNSTWDEYKYYSEIYKSTCVLKSEYSNTVSRSKISDPSKLIFCSGSEGFILKKIGRKEQDNYILSPMSEYFNLRNFCTSGYMLDSCLIYVAKFGYYRCYPQLDINFKELTTQEVLKKCGFSLSKHRIEKIDLSVSDMYFSVDVKIQPDELISNFDIGTSMTLRIYII